MGMAARTLTRDDWADAALEAIGRGGLAAVAVEPLAAGLGATKGSFYWHFPNRDALLETAMIRWEAGHTDAVIRVVQEQPDPLGRLRTLLALVLESTGSDPIELAVLATADHPLVAPVLARVTERRIAYTSGLFEELGFPPEQARHRGLLGVTAYLGLAQLAHATPGVVHHTASARREYLDLMVSVLTSRS
jgi:AcrR family transcriptional regulator